MVSISFSICCFVFLLIISIYYLSKEKLKSFDNSIFTSLLIINLIGLIIDLSGFVVFNTIGIESIFSIIIAKMFLLYFMFYVFCLMLYILNLSISLRKYGRRYIMLFLALCLIVLLLPINIYYEGTVAYTYGLSINVAYFVGFIMIMLMIIYSFKMRKVINKKKFILLCAFVLLTLSAVIVQLANPELTLLLFSNSVVTTLMYFTIENPDLKLLKEFSEAKDYAEKSNNEKTMFLYDISGKLKVPVTRILNQSNNILENTDKEEIDIRANDIKFYSKKLLQIIDNVLDISPLEKYEFKLMNSTYSIELLLRKIELIARKGISSKDIEFRFNMSSNLPKSVYGDSIRVKQIITIILDNAIKYTERGFIEVNVNSVIKNDMCRLIITIEDSGKGMTNDEIENIFDKNKLIDKDNILKIDTEKQNLAVASSLAKVIGGTMMVSSEIGKGTIFTVVLDQKISNEYQSENDKKIEEYRSQIHDKEKIMFIGYDKEDLKKMVKNIPYEVECVNIGVDCLNKLRHGIEYKLIIMKEDLEKLDGITVFNKIINEGYETKVVIVGKEIDNETLRKYKEEGLYEYIKEPLTKEVLDNLLNNCDV